MARIISTQVKTSFGAVIRNYYKEGDVVKSEANEIYPNDLVTDLSYVKDGNVVKLNGKVTDVNLAFDSATVNPNVSHDFLDVDAKVNTITVDHSTKNNGAIDVVPAREVIEYNTEKEVCKVTVKPAMKVSVKVTLSDKTSTEKEFKVGDFLFGVTLIGRGTETTSDYKVVAFSYSMSGNNKVNVNGVVLQDSKSTIVVPFTAIKVCGKDAIVITDATEVADAISKAMEDDTVGGVVLSNVKYENPINATKSLAIVGGKNTEVANVGNRKKDAIDKDETVFSGNITADADADLTITGVTFTKDALVVVNNAKSVTFKNCKFVDGTANQKKSYLILDKGSATTTEYHFDGCYFGNNSKNETGSIYNLFELNTLMSDGSSIKNCYFAKNCCTHNMINIYDVEEGATIEISGNIFEYSGNAVRIGIKGNKTATINCDNNTYMETDMSNDGAWAGFMIIQPCGALTKSFENITININNTVNKSGVDQIVYLYAGGSDTKITKALEPKVYVNKKYISLGVDAH